MITKISIRMGLADYVHICTYNYHKIGAVYSAGPRAPSPELQSRSPPRPPPP
eukprot:SAG22_NODE_12194_length_453_cov_0.731638_1_plen_51_part_10